MKVFKCLKCKRTRRFDDTLVMKVCYVCQIEMKEFEDGE